MTKIELQDFIFNSIPSRRQLLDYTNTRKKTYKIQVYRNHSFELVEHTLDAYLDYAQLGVEFEYSGYDDSFSFLDLNDDADAVIIWVDAKRYYQISFADFIGARITYLRNVYKKPILVIPYGETVNNIREDIATVFLLDSIEEKLGSRFIDERAAKITGTYLSNMAMSMISKELGLKYIPMLLKPSLKAVVVDFDNTLYQGILGEDGIEGIQLTKGHIELQQKLKELSQKGIFLCAASKNELEDVEKLLDIREDFILKKEDFTKLCVSWKPKAEAIAEISEYLNIGIDSIVMIDDNIGELTSLMMEYEQLHIIHAKDDAKITVDVLDSYPRLSLLHTTGEALIRKDDVIANETRRNLQNTVVSKEDYIKSLDIKLLFSINHEEQIPRISELANKTNQFIFNYKRYTIAEVEEIFKREDAAFITVSLEDCLSNSGLIAVCVAKKEKDYLNIEECFMSCRALGRGIDDVIVMGAIKLLAEELGQQKVFISFQEGERNRPAKEYIENYLLEYQQEAKDFVFEFPRDLIKITID